MKCPNYGIFFWTPFFTVGVYDLTLEPSKSDDIF